MEIRIFDEEALQAAAQKAFPDAHVEITQGDLYLNGKEAGRYRAPWLNQEFYVSTEYAYIDQIENGNRIRSKLHIPCVLVKQDPYEVIYDARSCFYAAYQSDGGIMFTKYVELAPQLGKDMELIEALTPVSQCSI